MKFYACDDIKCDYDARWVRRTQFAGDHLFCAIHALREENFLKEGNGDFYWMSLDEYRKFRARTS